MVLQNARNSAHIPMIITKTPEPLKVSNHNLNNSITSNYGNTLIEQPLRDSPYSQRLAHQYGAIVYSSERGGEGSF